MRLKGANVSSQSLRPSPCWYQAAIPCGSMPKGMEENQAVAASRSTQYVPAAMNASISPLEVASKQAKGAMIWPPG